jgi:hypothetical protein
MNVDDVIALLQNGVGEQVILDQVAAEGAHFELTTEDILDLRDAGASDELIRQLILTGSDQGSAGDWTRRYYAPTARVQLYYDPFGYNWYAWPFSFSYYYPFDWPDCGFYYAGWWNQRWWSGGPWHNYYWNHYHWDHYRPGRFAWDHNGRHVWGRASEAGRMAFDRAGALGRGRIDTRRGAVGGSRATPEVRTTPAPRTRDRHAYGRGDGSGGNRSAGANPPRTPQPPERNGSPSAQPSPPSAPPRGQPAPSNPPRERSGWRR